MVVGFLLLVSILIMEACLSPRAFVTLRKSRLGCFKNCATRNIWKTKKEIITTTTIIIITATIITVIIILILTTTIIISQSPCSESVTNVVEAGKLLSDLRSSPQLLIHLKWWQWRWVFVTLIELQKPNYNQLSERLSSSNALLIVEPTPTSLCSGKAIFSCVTFSEISFHTK